MAKDDDNSVKERRIVDRVMRDLETAFETAFKEERNLPVDKKRHYELHPSTFPYCGLQHFWSIMNGEEPHPKSDTNRHSPWPNSGSYYTGVGTTVHSWVQDVLHKHLGDHKGDMIGDWRCGNPKCGSHKYKQGARRSDILFAFHSWSELPDECPVCNWKGNAECGADTFVYEELGLKLGKRTHGHIDGLYRYPLKGQPLYFLVDYKTTSAFGCYKHRTYGNQFPYKKNKAQIKSYCGLVSEQYNIPIAGWILIYLARDNPQKDKVLVGVDITPEEVQKAYKQAMLWDKCFDLIRTADEEGYCLSKKDVGTLVKCKTCKSQKRYEAIMKDDFHECPLAPVCFDPERLKKKLKKAYSVYMARQLPF